MQATLNVPVTKVLPLKKLISVVERLRGDGLRFGILPVVNSSRPGNKSGYEVWREKQEDESYFNARGGGGNRYGAIAYRRSLPIDRFAYLFDGERVVTGDWMTARARAERERD